MPPLLPLLSRLRAVSDVSEPCKHNLSLRISPPQNGLQRIECGECGLLLRMDPVTDTERGWPS